MKCLFLGILLQFVLGFVSCKRDRLCIKYNQNNVGKPRAILFGKILPKRAGLQQTLVLYLNMQLILFDLLQNHLVLIPCTGLVFPELRI